MNTRNVDDLGREIYYELDILEERFKKLDEKYEKLKEEIKKSQRGK